MNVCENAGGLEEACTAPLYKGKRGKVECANYRGISFSSIPDNVYGRLITEKEMARTEKQTSDE